MIVTVDSQDTDRIQYVANVTRDHDVQNCEVIYWDEDNSMITKHPLGNIPKELKEVFIENYEHELKVICLNPSDDKYDEYKDFCAESF